MGVTLRTSEALDQNYRTGPRLPVVVDARSDLIMDDDRSEIERQTIAFSAAIHILLASIRIVVAVRLTVYLTLAA